MSHAGDSNAEQHTITDALKSSPFSAIGLLKGMFSGGGRGDNGGGMGDAFNAVTAQASLDRGMQHNIYEKATGLT